MTANPFLISGALGPPVPIAAKVDALQAAKKTAALASSTPLPAPSSDSSIDALINHYSQLYGVNPHIARAQMMAESSGDPHARSNAGAMGLFQLMPATAQELGVSDPYNPDQNIRGGIQYLAQQLKRFGGSYAKALAAFNAGPGAVEKYGGVPPYAETQAYVKKILGNAKDAAGDFLTQLQRPIVQPADAAEVSRETTAANPFLQGKVTQPLGDTSNPFLQQVATDTAMQDTSQPQWAPPGTVAKQMGMDMLGTLSRAAGAVKHWSGDVLGGLNNLEQSLGPQRVISEAIAGRPVHYAPTTQDAPGLTDAALNNLQNAAQQGSFTKMGLPELDMLLGHAGIQPEQPVGDVPAAVPGGGFVSSMLGGGFMQPLEQAMLKGYASGGMQNSIRRQLYEAGTDPVMWGLGALGKVASGIGDFAKSVGVTDKVAQAAAPLANNKLVQGTRDVFEANAPTKRAYGGEINSILDTIENRNNQLGDLEGIRHQQLLAQNAPDIQAAENAGITANAKPVLPAPIQTELDRDSWLLGTQRVRNLMQRKFGYTPTPDIAQAPLLNVLHGYQPGYVPMKEVLSDEAFNELQNAYDAAAGMRDNRPLSFTLRADDPELATSPLMDRLAYRLKQGRDVRAMLNTRQQILSQLGVFPKPPGTAMLKAQMLNLPKPGLDAASDVAREALQKQIDNLDMMQALYEKGLQGSTLHPEDELVPVTDRHLGFLDPDTLDTSQLHNLTDAQKTQFRNMAVKEANTFMLPPAIAQRLYRIGAKQPLNVPFLRSLADLRRAALFTLPFGHMKNIGSLQLEGPGGLDALTNAMRYGDGEVAARTPELAEMGAMGMGAQHDLPQVNLFGWKPYESKGIQQAWLDSQGALGDFDARQRLALHDSLMASDPAYAAMDPLQRGAKINSVLFDYSHPSLAAQSLRGVGSTFPAWRLGSIALQGRRLADSPGRVALFGKAQAMAQNALNGDPSDPNGYGWRFNTPLEEAMKFGADSLTAGLNPLANQWLMTTLGLGGAPYAGDAQDQTRVQALQKLAEGFVGENVPLGNYGEDLTGLSPFSSRAPGYLQALAGIMGASAKNHPNPKQEAIEEIMAENPFIQRPQAQALIRRRRHGPGI